MRKREHQWGAHSAMNAVDRLIRPVTEQELKDVVSIWVDCAARLDTRSLEWMQRLYQRQLSIFGDPGSASRADSADEASPQIAA